MTITKTIDVKNIFDKHINIIMHEFVNYEESIIDTRDFLYDVGELFIDYIKEELKIRLAPLKLDIKYNECREFIFINEVK